MRVLSASGIERAMHCVASTAMPAVGSTSSHAERGTAIHLYISNAFIGESREGALLFVEDEYRKECAEIDIEMLRKLLPGRIHSEIAGAYNASTDGFRLIESSDHRDYGSFTVDDVCCTADLISVDDICLNVVEIKTGDKVADACENWQLKTQAFIFNGIYKKETIQASIAYLQDDGSWALDQVFWDCLDVDSFGSDLVALVDNRKTSIEKYQSGAALDVNEGAWCKYCPAMAHCPAKINLVKSMQLELSATDVTAERLKQSAMSLTKEQAGVAWEKIVRYEKLIETMKVSLQARAAQEPLPLSNGKILKEVESSREYVNGSKAYPVLLKNLGRDGVDKCMTLSTNKSAIEKAVGDKKQAKKIIDELRQEGAIASKSYKQVKEV